MTSSNMRLVAYAMLALFCIALMGVWGWFAFDGKTDVGAFIAQIKDLIGIVVALALGLGGFHAAVAQKAPVVATLAAGVVDLSPAQPPEPVTPAPTVIVHS
jgi:hypothetical protein